MEKFFSSTQQGVCYTLFWLNSVAGRFQGDSSTQSMTININPILFLAMSAMLTGSQAKIQESQSCLKIK